MIGIGNVGRKQIEPVERSGGGRRERGDRRVGKLGDLGRGARGVGIAHRLDPVRLEPVAALAERLRMAHRLADTIARSDPHQRVADRQEMLARDHQPRFREQEMDIGDAAVERILDRNDRAVGAAVLHRVDRIGKVETGQRQAVRKCLGRRDMAVGAGRALKRDRARGLRHRGLGHPRDDRTGGGGEVFHRHGA